MAIMGYKARTSLRESAMLDMPLVSIAEGTRILPDDAGQLARAMARLATDAPLRRRLAQSAQDRVRREFLTEVVFERLATAYRGLLEGERA